MKKPGIVAVCFSCGYGYTEYSHEVQDEHFANVCPNAPEKLKVQAAKRLGQAAVDPKATKLKADNGRRITTVLACLSILCPDADLHSKRKLARQILALVDGHDRTVPQRTITDAQVVEMVWRHSQCVLNQTGRCPLLVFGRQLSEEINEFFTDDE
jgi:hypothetical protein